MKQVVFLIFWTMVMKIATTINIKWLAFYSLEWVITYGKYLKDKFPGISQIDNLLDTAEYARTLR